MPYFSYAQSVQITPRNMTEALRQLMAQTQLKIVFSANLVSQKTTSCQYQGENAVEALYCILRNSNLEVQQSPSGQWIITPKRIATHDLSANQSSVTPRDNQARQSENDAFLSALVIDAQTQQPLTGASVAVLNTSIGGITDVKGVFKIENVREGTYSLRISFVGYEPLFIGLHTNVKSKIIALNPIEIEAASFVVDADAQIAARINIAEGAVSFSSRQLDEQLAFQGQEDLFQLLGSTSNINRSSEMNGDLIIRGADDGQNLYLIDNVPVYNPQRSFGQFSLFQSDLLQNVTLYKGSMPAVFGGRLSSLVLAELKDGNGDRPHVSTAISRYSARMMVEAPIQPYASLMMAGRLSLSDVFGMGVPLQLQNKSGVYDVPSHYNFADFTSKLTLRPHKNHQLSLNFYRGKDNLRVHADENAYPELYRALGNRSEDNWKGIDANLKQHFNNGYESVRYRYVSSPLLVTLTGYHTAYNSTETDSVYASSAPSFALSNGFYHARMDEHGIKSEIDYVMPNFEAQIGGSVVQYRYHSTLELENPFIRKDRETSYSLTETAIYANVIVAMSPKLHIEPGLRIGAIEKAYFLPQLFARYVFNPNVSAKIGVSNQSQQLHWLRDRFALVTTSNTLPQTDRLHIRPSQSKQFSASLETKPAKGIYWETNVYWRESWNVLIAQNPYRLRSSMEQPLSEMALRFEQYTPGNTESYGLETSFKLDRKQWQGYVNYNFSRSKNEFENEVYSFPARFDAPHTLNSALRWNKLNFYIMLSGELRTGYPILNNQSEMSAAFDIMQQDAKTKRLRTYRRMDMVLGRTFKGNNMSGLFELQFFNVTNSKNILDQTIGNSLQPLELSGARFTPSFSLKLSF